MSRSDFFKSFTETKTKLDSVGSKNVEIASQMSDLHSRISDLSTEVLNATQSNQYVKTSDFNDLASSLENCINSLLLDQNALKEKVDELNSKFESFSQINKPQKTDGPKIQAKQLCLTKV